MKYFRLSYSIMFVNRFNVCHILYQYEQKQSNINMNMNTHTKTKTKAYRHKHKQTQTFTDMQYTPQQTNHN